MIRILSSSAIAGKRAAGIPAREDLLPLVGILERGIREGLFPGAVFGIGRAGRFQATGCAGKPAPDSPRPTLAGDLYDMASVTKPTTTATIAMRLLDRGLLDPDRRVEDVLERPLSAAWRRITVRHLLTHTAGIVPHRPFFRKCRNADEMIDAILALEPGPPGRRYVYTCLGYIVLGRVLERIGGDRLDRLARREIRRPLRMPRACYNPSPKIRNRIAPTEFCPWRGRRIRGEVHDENAWAMGGISGNAGLFASALDLHRYAWGILGNRDARGARYLSRKSRNLLLRNQIEEIGGHATCGWVLGRYGLLQGMDEWSSATVCHTGFTGTSLILDPGNDGYAFLLTNRVYFGRERFAPYAGLRRRWWREAGRILVRRGRAAGEGRREPGASAGTDPGFH